MYMHGTIKKKLQLHIYMDSNYILSLSLSLFYFFILILLRSKKSQCYTKAQNNAKDWNLGK